MNILQHDNNEQLNIAVFQDKTDNSKMFLLPFSEE